VSSGSPRIVFWTKSIRKRPNANRPAGDSAYGELFRGFPKRRSALRSRAKLVVTGLGVAVLTVALGWILRPDWEPIARGMDGGRAASGQPAVRSRDPIHTLARALGARRLIEPRIVGGFQYAPCTAAPSSPDDLIPLPQCSGLPAPQTREYREITDVGIGLQSGTAGAGTGPLLHARGIWRLLWAHDDDSASRAVHDLETAATLADHEPRTEAEALSDLAAAYLVRAAFKDQPLDLILALDASGRALEQQPELPEALFNHALAIESLHLRTEARTAWEDVLNAEPTGPWAEEARQHLERLEQPTVLEAWKLQRPLLERAARQGDQEEVDRLVAAFGPPVRDWIEEDLLPAWGEAALAGNASEAAETLAVARVTANALARLVGEHMPADAVAAIDRAGAQGRSTLAEGHRSFGAGMAKYGAHDCTGATERFAAAETQLEEGASPFAGRALLQQEICIYYQEPTETIGALAEVLEALPAGRYPTLEGKIAWMNGLCRADGGDLSGGLDDFRHGMDVFDRIADPDRGALRGYVARVEEFLGRTDEAWHQRQEALTILAPHGDPRRLYNVLHEIVDSLMAEDRPDLSTHFQEELLAQARAWGEPGPLADAQLTRARVLLALGDDRNALDALDEARQTAQSTPPGAIRDRLEADLEAGPGQALVRTDPETAARTLTEAIQRYREIHHVASVPDLLISRSQASRALGDVAAAQEDLNAAIRIYEARRLETNGSRTDRIGLFARAQRAYDATITLQLDEHNDPLGALLWSDRSRSRELRQGLAADPRPQAAPAAPATVDELVRRVPDHVTMVEYAMLPDRLIYWILNDRLQTIVRTVSESELRRLIDSVRALVEARAPEQEIAGYSSRLFELLMRPVVDASAPGDLLLLVPDRSLHRLPFAALWDERAGRYLVETHPLVEASSLALDDDHPRDPPRASTPSSVLSVGSSRFDSKAFPDLRQLPGAEIEARQVAALYPRGDLLIGDDATVETFLGRLSRAQVVHVAGHALLDFRWPERSELVLAPTAPGAGDGTISATELSRADLHEAQLVYLSACRTAAEAPTDAREGMAGLAQAALLAGAQAVVASRWDIDDDAALAMARSFHTAYARGASPMTALRSAQRSLLTAEGERFRHPASWSGFSVQIADPSGLASWSESSQTARTSP